MGILVNLICVIFASDHWDDCDFLRADFEERSSYPEPFHLSSMSVPLSVSRASTVIQIDSSLSMPQNDEHRTGDSDDNLT
jgi:hypothetical protein